MFNIFNIVFDKKSHEERDIFFDCIGDLSNPNPDLFEYHHIIKYYEEHRHLWKKNEFYGFFSTNFFLKTGLEGENFLNILKKFCNKETKIIVVNPWWRLFQSKIDSFHQGEFNHPGLIECFDKVLIELNFDPRKKSFFSSSENTAYSNFFIAKPEIWDKWIGLVKSILLITADTKHPLSSKLNAATRYKNKSNPMMCIFILERIINYLISYMRSIEITGINSFDCKMDAINLAPAYAEQIDHARIHCNRSGAGNSDELIDLTWQLSKIEEIEKWIGAGFYDAAANIIRSERFNSIFDITIEMKKIKILSGCAKYDEAILRLRDVKKLYSSSCLDFDIVFYRLLIENKNLVEARKKIEELLEKFPESHVLTCDYLSILLALEDYRKCVDKINLAISKFPRSWLIPIMASKLCQIIGQKDKAQEYMLLAIGQMNSRRRIDWNMI